MFLDDRYPEVSEKSASPRRGRAHTRSVASEDRRGVARRRRATVRRSRFSRRGGFTRWTRPPRGASRAASILPTASTDVRARAEFSRCGRKSRAASGDAVLSAYAIPPRRRPSREGDLSAADANSSADSARFFLYAASFPHHVPLSPPSVSRARERERRLAHCATLGVPRCAAPPRQQQRIVLPPTGRYHHP